ncbi:hypothetical protein PtA15_13A287 [Puccinia triticina]|uniref:Uncharacterized protein n=1 Tax=Puccinia triticina TaxID=208348 RepID=A0ABY7D3N8_9BASI|nr:uncharacterized protein PtA15_13A287 [Puccinia triticina]WAQ90887.1 hypothetical protein PtA15_13A287 [Puccinia triticina]
MAILVQSNGTTNSSPYTCLADKDKPEASCVRSDKDDQGALTYFGGSRKEAFNRYCLLRNRHYTFGLSPHHFM